MRIIIGIFLVRILKMVRKTKVLTGCIAVFFRFSTVRYIPPQDGYLESSDAEQDGIVSDPILQLSGRRCANFRITM